MFGLSGMNKTIGEYYEKINTETIEVMGFEENITPKGFNQLNGVEYFERYPSPYLSIRKKNWNPSRNLYDLMNLIYRMRYLGFIWNITIDDDFRVALYHDSKGAEPMTIDSDDDDVLTS